MPTGRDLNKKPDLARSGGGNENPRLADGGKIRADQRRAPPPFPRRWSGATMQAGHRASGLRRGGLTWSPCDPVTVAGQRRTFTGLPPLCATHPGGWRTCTVANMQLSTERDYSTASTGCQTFTRYGVHSRSTPRACPTATATPPSASETAATLVVSCPPTGTVHATTAPASVWRIAPSRRRT